jgi:cysteine synthase
MIGNDVIGLIGNTPMVRINKLNTNRKVNIYAKLEGHNPGGSIKDRIARYMIEGAEKEGRLTKDMTIVEPTSGNTGIGIAMVAAAKGYRCVIVMPETMSVERRKILKAYGADLILTKVPEGENPQRSMDFAIYKAEEMAKDSRYFRPDQFSNEYNTLSHYETTGPEIWKDMNGKIDMFIAGLGTCGTMMGAGKYLKERNPGIKLVAVEPDKATPIQGLKNMEVSIKPGILDESGYDEKMNVNVQEAIRTSRDLARSEGIFAGISSGAAMFAALQKARVMKEGNIAVILPDGGMKYLSTPLAD